MTKITSERQGETTMLKNILIIMIMAATAITGITGTARAMISEPSVVYYGTATSAAAKDKVTLTLSGATTPVASCTVGADLKYVLRVPMDSVGARLPNTARTGDAGGITINGAMAAKVVIPARGTLVKMDVTKRDADQWGKDHPGDSGAGDMNRNGISDLTEYLDGKDPASCVWKAVDAGHAESDVFNPLVLKNCLADAGNDLKHNLIKVAKGTYAGNFSYNAVWGEEYDLTLIGGYDPAGVAERAADPALTVLNGDTDNDGAGNGITLAVDTDSGKSRGKIRIESLNVKNGKATAGQKGGGIQARIYQGGLELVGNIISGNSADGGGGLSVDSSDSAPVFLANNIIYGNSAANAAAVRIVSATGPVTLLNNSIADNTASASGDGRSVLIETTAASVDLTNNIVVASAGVSGSDIFINSSGVTIPLTISHNGYDAVSGLLANSPGFVADANAIFAAPQFVNATAGDYRLGFASPCVDKGIAHAKQTEKDAAGAIRTSGLVDLGAYEFYKSVATITFGNLSSTYDGTARTVTAVTDPAGKPVTFTYDGSSAAPVNAGSYTVVATINDGDYQGTTSGTLVVGKADHAIGTIGIAPATLVVNGTTTASATASSGLVVAFTSTTPAVCTVSGTSVTALAAGLCAIAANQVGSASFNAAPQMTQNISVSDITAPTLALSTLADKSFTANATLNVSGTVDSKNGVKSVTVNGKPVIISNGTFTTAITLVDGPNSITTIATDNSGNKTTDTRSVTLDRTAPGLAIIQPADNSITSKTFADITGSVDDQAATVNARVNGGSATSATMDGTSFSVTVNLSSGLNTIDLTVTDQAGNSSSAKRSVKSDTTAPTLAITVPAQDISTTQGSITISGAVADSVTSATVGIKLDDLNFTPTVAADGSFSQAITMATEKTYAVIVTATDQAGNSATVQRNIIKSAESGASGDINGDGTVDIADALKALRIAVGLEIATAADYAKGDVAPLKEGKPAPDGVIDIADAVVILQKSVGLQIW